MKKLLWLVLLLACSGSFVLAAETQAPGAAPEEKAGVELSRSISKITGVAMSPLLGMGVVGAYDYFKAPKEKKDALSWYARPAFWLPVLLLVGVVGCKDAFGTVLPPGLKKPIDVAETIENKVSALVATGAFVPIASAVFHSSGDAAQALIGHGLNALGFAAIDLKPLLDILLVPFAMVAFVVVWLVCHAINVLILISPFGAVDAVLKAIRVFLMSLVSVTSFANPYAGAILSLVIILLAYLLAGWSFRMMVFGSVYVWDFCTFRSRRFKPAPNGNWMFAARKIEKTPIRTYGKLVRNEPGGLVFEYRPWLVMKPRTLTLPAGTYAVGRGLFYPEIMRVEGENTRTMLVLPPRYRSHEEAVNAAYGLAGIRDVGLLKGFKAIWKWLKGLFGAKSEAAAAPA